MLLLFEFLGSDCGYYLPHLVNTVLGIIEQFGHLDCLFTRFYFQRFILPNHIFIILAITTCIILLLQLNYMYLCY